VLSGRSSRVYGIGMSTNCICSRLGAFLLALLASIGLGTWDRAEAAQGDCGQPISSGDVPTPTDTLFVLRTAVGLETCSNCVCDYDGSGAVVATDALLLLNVNTGVMLTPDCPVCDPSGECPGIAQFVLFAGVRGPCAINADCGGLGICDPTIGRCRTGSRFDGGWTGLAHDTDVNDIVPSRLLLACDADTAPCGTCQFVGLDPVFRNCRCDGDNRTVCFQPFQNDDVSCGGQLCRCYFGPPTPASSGNTPACTTSEILTVSGSANADLGSGTISLDLRSDVALGESQLSPCPYCDGDATPGDGINDGTCVGGKDDGLSCDAQSGNSTFPAPTGGRSSLDCLSSPDRVVSGPGVRTDLDISTGRAELAAGLKCTPNPLFGGLRCPCRVCSGDPTLACSSDVFCMNAGAGTCTSDGNGVSPRPNACTDGVCVDVGNFQGQCNTGPVTRYCDGIVRADQTGLLSCLTNVDCSVEQLGFDAGSCTLSEIRRCFLDPIVAQGAANPIAPLGAAVFCTPPTSSGGINGASGLPGPSRVVYQTLLSLFCASDPQAQYVPGVGGCP